MTLFDPVAEVLTYLTDGGGANENWDTSNYDPAPILYNERSGVRQDTSDVVEHIDLRENAVINVNPDPPLSNQPVGTEYDNRFRMGAGVRIEALNDAAGGTITDDSDWNSLVEEAKRAIRVERTIGPTSTNEYGTLQVSIEEENDNSTNPERGQSRSERLVLYEYEFDVWFEGVEELP